MSNRILNLIFKVKGADSAQDAFGRLALGVTGVNQALQLAQELGEAAKKAFDFAEEGAQLRLTEERFNRLAESVGTTGKALSVELDDAIKGTMSQMEGMALATDFMSLGLAKNADEATRLAAISANLGMNMNQLVLTLTNQTTMRFDALGVAVDGFDEKVKALEESGLATNEAFKFAFMEQAEEQIERVGSVADTAAGEFMQLKAAFADWMDEQKKLVSDIITPMLVNINNQRDYNDVLDELGGIYRSNNMDMAEYRDIVVDVGMGVLDQEEATKLLVVKLEEAKQEYLRLNPELEHYLEMQVASAVATEEAAVQKTWLAIATSILADGFNLETIKIMEQVAALERLKAAQGALAGALPSLTAGLSGGYTEWGNIDPYANAGGYATGGSFTVGGGGGSDTTPVGFMATPGETVSIGGGTNDNQQILAEMRRLVNTLPTILVDALERR